MITLNNGSVEEFYKDEAKMMAALYDMGTSLEML